MSTNNPNTNEPHSSPAVPKSPTVASIANGFQRVRTAFSSSRNLVTVDPVREDKEAADRARRDEAIANHAYVRKTSVGISACTHPDYPAQQKAEGLAQAERRAEDANVIAISDAIPAGEDPDENTKYTLCDVDAVDTGSMGSGSSDEVIELKRLDAAPNERCESTAMVASVSPAITNVNLPARPRPARTKQVHFRSSVVRVENVPIRLRSTDPVFAATMVQAEAGTSLPTQGASSPSWWNLAARVRATPTEVLVKRLYYFGYCAFAPSVSITSYLVFSIFSVPFHLDLWCYLRLPAW